MPTNEMIVISGKKYCPHCSEEPLKEAQYYKELCTYIADLFGGAKNCNMPLITAQLKRLKKNNEEMTTRGMLSTLQYVFEILEYEFNVDPNYGIENILTRYYWEAKQYYIKRAERNKANKDVFEALNQETEQIVLNRSDLIRRQEEEDKKKDEREHRVLIDADNIEDDGLTLNIDEEFKRKRYYSSCFNSGEDW